MIIWPKLSFGSYSLFEWKVFVVLGGQNVLLCDHFV